MSLAERLRGMRVARGMSLRQLARRARLNPSTLSRWESGVTLPRVYELKAVLNALGASEVERARIWHQLQAPRAIMHSTAEDRESLLPAGSAPIGGELLRALRWRKGWTLQQVALFVGVTVSMIRRWERSESWPSSDQLMRLCQVLDADELEQTALQNGRGVLNWLPFPVITASEMADLLEALRTWQLPIDPVLVDLIYRCIQGRLWQMVGERTAPQSLLIDAFAYHCRYLVEQARLDEAQVSADRAFRLFSKAEPLRPQWFNAVHAHAKGVAESQARLAPLEGVDILRYWLPYAQRDAPEYAAWFERNIAEYMSFSRHRQEARVLYKVAQQHSAPWIGQDPSIALSAALVLANIGQSDQAHHLLSDTHMLVEDPRYAAQQCINLSLVWVRVLWAQGLTDEAAPWIEQLRHLIPQASRGALPWWHHWLQKPSG